MIDSEDSNPRTELSDERSESADALGLERIVGQSPGIRDVRAAINRIAPQDNAVLIVGETGTGRSLVAQTIHDRSPRSQQPFVTVNGAASELEDELYGRAPDSQVQPGGTVGKCEAVSGGTLFVDDIGAVGTTIQAGVQRLIQEQRFDRRDKGDSAAGNVRIIASAERDLSPAVQGGYFRRDLHGQFQGATHRRSPSE